MNTEKIMEDIQTVQDNIRDIKSTWGNTIMTLDNIKSGLKADVQKKVDEAYQRGLEDAWEAAKKIFGYEIDGAIPIADIGNVFGYEPCKAFCTADILRDFTVQEAIAKLKAYEDKHSDRIEVGDEVQAPRGKAIITAVKDDFVHYFYSDGDIGCIEPHHVTKTGKHYDIASILEGMKK